jgi:hypothetical protein
MKFPISHITHLLISHGWRAVERAKFNEHLLLFTNARFPNRELSLPKKESASDYEDAVSILLSKLAALEKQSIEKLTREIGTAREGQLPHSADSFILRIVQPSDDGEGIPLTLARTALTETEVLILAASCQTQKPETYYRRIDNKISNALLERAVFNHTRYGSFVLSVSCPILSTGEQLPLGLEKNDLPVTRKTFLALHTGIAELESAVSERKHIQFANDVLASTSPHVSANIAQAIGNIAASDTGGGVEFGFAWSELIVPTAESYLKEAVLFSQNDAAQIYEVAERLRPQEASHTNRFIGTVEALRGDLTEGGRRAGWIELALNLPEVGWVRATAALSADQYKEADTAHISGAQFIAITGTLEPRPRVWIFSAIEKFERVASP